MKKNKPLLIFGIIIGTLLFLGPIWGFVLTELIAEALKRSDVADPRTIALDIMVSLTGFIVCPMGLLILILSIIFLVRKQMLSPPPLPNQS